MPQDPHNANKMESNFSRREVSKSVCEFLAGGIECNSVQTPAGSLILG